MFETTEAAITDLETVMEMARLFLPVAPVERRAAYFRCERLLQSMRKTLAEANEEWPKFQEFMGKAVAKAGNPEREQSE